MIVNKETASILPLMAMDDIPDPKPDAAEIVALVKQKGRIAGYELSDGRVLSREEGVSLAKAGGIQGVGVAHNKNTEYLKSLPDQDEDNNLGSLPASTKHLM